MRVLSDQVADLVQAEAAITRVANTVFRQYGQKARPFESDIGIVPGHLQRSLREIHARSTENAKLIHGLVNGFGNGHHRWSRIWRVQRSREGAIEFALGLEARGID